MAIRTRLLIALMWFTVDVVLSGPFSFFLDFNILETNFRIYGENFPCTGMPYEFPCGDDDHSCFYTFYFCDTIIDCPNGFDENPFFCTTAWNRLCEVEEDFQKTTTKRKPFELAYCNNTMCITECDVCDGQYIDCADESDEDPAICLTDRRPQRIGDCSTYRKTLPASAQP